MDLVEKRDWIVKWGKLWKVLSNTSMLWCVLVVFFFFCMLIEFCFYLLQLELKIIGTKLFKLYAHNLNLKDDTLIYLEATQFQNK